MDPIEPSSQQDEYQVLIQKGKAALEAGEAEAAKDCFQQALTLKPHCADTLVDMGNVYLDLKKYDEAEGYYQKALELDKSSYRAYCNLGLLLYKTSKSSEAEKAFLKSLEIKPDFLPSLNGLGNLYSDLNQLGRAKEIYMTALALEPNSYLIIYNLAKCYISEKEFGKALEFLERLFSILPSKHKCDLYFLLAEAYYGNGDYEHSIGYYLKLSELKPDVAYYYQKIGDMYYFRGHVEEAIRYYEKSLDLKTFNQEDWESVLKLHAKYSALGDSVRFAERALALFPTSYFILFHYARLSYENGDYQNALRYSVKAKEIVDNDPDCYAVLSLALIKLGNIEEALDTLQAVLKYVEYVRLPNFEKVLLKIVDELHSLNYDELSDEFKRKAKEVKHLQKEDKLAFLEKDWLSI